jgi:hypothetical protein
MVGIVEERGQSVSVEASVLTPVIVLVVALLFGCGAVRLAQHELDQVVWSAARALSVSEKLTKAEAEKRVEKALEQQGLECIGGPQISMSRPKAVFGDFVQAEIQVKCWVEVPIFGELTLASSAESTVDTWKGE